MKKIVNILFATAVAALAIISCQKKELANVDVNENETVESPIHFYATEIVTKTVFDDLSAGQYPTLWTITNDVKISQNEANSVTATVTPKNSNTQADFTPSPAITSDGSGNYKFYALSPASAQVSNINKTNHRWNLEIPANQTPLGGSVDEAAQIITAAYNAGTTYPTSVPFAFNHVTAYGLISFSNLALDGGETISSVTLQATQNWVGRWYYYVEDYDSNGDSVVDNAAGSIEASSASDIITLTTSSSSDIWFACAPVNLEGETVTVTVTTNLGTFSKDIVFPSGKGNFQAGHVASFTIDMDGIVRVTPVVYTKVTDVADLTIDSEVIIVSSTQALAAGLLNTNTYLNGAAVTKTSNTINSPSAAVEVYKIKNGNVAGTYGLMAKSDDKYLKWKEAAKVEAEASVSNASSWAIAINGEGVASIRSYAEPTRYLLYNTDYTRFSTYTPGVDYPDVLIYKNYSTGTSTAITAKTITEIEVVGATTEYAKGAAYAFDGTVNLLYSDLSKKALASSEYTVSPGSIDTSTGGVYTVTVTYNENASIKTTYDVIVGGLTVVYDFTNSANYPGTISTSGNAASTATEFTFGTNKLTIKANNSCYRINASAPYALFWGKSKKNDIAGSSYIEIPGKSGYNMVRVTVTNGANCAANVNVNIYDSSNTAKSTSVKTVKGGSMTFNVTSPAVNTPYKISSGDDGKNFQFASITVIYVES